MSEEIRTKVVGLLEAVGQYKLTDLNDKIAEECGVEWPEVRSVVKQLKRRGQVNTFRVGNYWVAELAERTPTGADQPRPEGAVDGPVEFVPGMDLKAIENKEERRRAYKAFNALRRQEDSKWTLVDRRYCQLEKEDLTCDAYWDAMESAGPVVSVDFPSDMWRKYGVRTEDVLFELKSVGYKWAYVPGYGPTWNNGNAYVCDEAARASMELVRKVVDACKKRGVDPRELAHNILRMTKGE